MRMRMSMVEMRMSMKKFLWIPIFLCCLLDTSVLYAQVVGLRADSPEAARKFRQLQFESRLVQMQIAPPMQTEPPAKIGYRENILWETKPGKDLPRHIRVGEKAYFLSGTTARVEKIVDSRRSILRFEDSSTLFYLQEYSTNELTEGMEVTLVGPVECTGTQYGHRVLKFISPSEIKEKEKYKSF